VIPHPIARQNRKSTGIVTSSNTGKSTGIVIYPWPELWQCLAPAVHSNYSTGTPSCQFTDIINKADKQRQPSDCSPPFARTRRWTSSPSSAASTRTASASAPRTSSAAAPPAPSDPLGSEPLQQRGGRRAEGACGDRGAVRGRAGWRLVFAR
jgi:hypothetical protein